MDVIEKAIRNAFEKGNASDQAFREKVYRQAFAALDRVLQANPNVTVESAIKRRKSLQAKIVEIEQEFLPSRPPTRDPLLVTVPPLPTAAPAQETAVPPAVEPDVSDVAAAAAATAPEPTVEADRPGVPDAAPVVAVDVAPPQGTNASHTEEALPDPVIPPGERRELPGSSPADVSMTEDGRPHARERRRRPLAAIFVAATLFSALAIGVWWAVQTGLLRSATGLEVVGTTEPDTEDFEPGADEPPVQPGQADTQRSWIPVFASTDSDAISAPSDASAEVMEDEGAGFVRIKSGTSGSAVVFDVGQGVLEQIAGKRATFDIVARAEEGQDTQMSVACNFGELGDCGRKRYAVGNERGDYLFEIDVPAKRPGAGGTIAINSDFDKAGKSVDIYEIKVSIDQ